MKIRHYVIGITGVLLLSLQCAAEVMSRQEAIAIALQANPDVVKGQQQLKYLEGRILEERSNALPELTATSTSTRYVDPSFLNNAGLDQLPAQWLTAFSPTAQNLFEGSFTVKQTLYSFKLGKAIKAAKLARRVGGEDLQRIRQQIALDTSQAYNALLFANEQVRVQLSAMEQREKHLEMTRNRRESGVATELDVLRAQVNLENQRAELTRAEGTVDLARAQLNALMLRDMESPITPSDVLEYKHESFLIEDIVREAMANRPDLRVAELTADVREQLVGVAKAASKPSLDFSGTYGKSSRLTDNLFDPEYRKWNTTLSLKVPVFDGERTKGQVEQAKAEFGKAIQDKVALKNQIRLQAMDSLVKLNVSSRLIEAAETNVSQAQKALDMTQANYKYGAATVLDVTDAQNALVQAETTLAQALQQHADAIATVNYVMGRDPAGSDKDKSK